MKLELCHAGLSDRGRVRERNEDNWAADPKEGLYIVSDGLGGHFQGALASEIVVKTLPELIRKELSGIEDLNDALASERVSAAICRLSNELHERTEGEPGMEGMGATAVLSLIRNSTALIAHVGDSRAYLWREGELQQLTKDHSIVQLLLDSGEIKPEEVRGHPARGRVTRSVGMDGEPLPEAQVVELQPGDRLLFCTDGLVGMLSDEEILGILNQRQAPEESCCQLVETANEASGRDNITVLIVEASSVAPGNSTRKRRSDDAKLEARP